MKEGKKSAPLVAFADSEIRPMLNYRRIVVKNPATGQDLCTYVFYFPGLCLRS